MCQHSLHSYSRSYFVTERCILSPNVPGSLLEHLVDVDFLFKIIFNVLNMTLLS